MRTRNKLMTLALAVIYGISIITASVKAETMYYETEDGMIAYEEDEVILSEQLADGPQSRVGKLDAPAGLKWDAEHFGTIMWNPVEGAE